MKKVNHKEEKIGNVRIIPRIQVKPPMAPPGSYKFGGVTKRGYKVVARPPKLPEEKKLNELSPETKKSYEKKALDDLHYSNVKYGRTVSTTGLPKGYKKKELGKLQNTMDKRERGLKRLDRMNQTSEGTYFTRTRSNKSRGQIMKKQLRPKIEPLMKDIGFKRGSYKMEPNSSANNLIITVKKSDLNKVKKALKPLGLPNIVQVVSEDMNEAWPAIGYGLARAAPWLAKNVNPNTAGAAVTTAMTGIQKAKDYFTNKKKKQNEGKKPGIWDAIRKRRAKGLPRLKPGQEGYPKTLKGHESVQQEMMTTGDAGIPQDTKNMGPRLVNMTDRRRRKDKVPVLLKRFRKYMYDNGGDHG